MRFAFITGSNPKDGFKSLGEIRKGMNLRLYESVKYFLISVFPIMSLYGFLPIFNLGNLSLLVLVVIRILFEKEVRINTRIFFIMYTLIILNNLVGLFKYVDLENTVNNSIGIAVFGFLAMFICVPGYLDSQKLYTTCKYTAYIVTFLLFYQFAFQYISGTTIRLNIPFLQPTEEAARAFAVSIYGRNSSLFLEPAHFAIYIIPVYAISLVQRDYVASIVFLLGLVISTSSTGIALAAIIPLIFFVSSKDRKRTSMIPIVGALSLAIYWLQANFYNRFIYKLSLENLLTDIRVFGTWSYLQYFSENELLFGIGINRLREFSIYQGFFVSNYANSYIYSIISFGILGSLIWFGYNVSLYRYISKSYKIMFFILLLISMTDQILFNRNLMYLLIWVYASSSAIKKGYSLPKEEMRPSYHERM